MNKKIVLVTLIILTIIISLNSCKTYKELSTVKEVDINKYLGTWYEIARLPNSFEKNMKCVTATYSLKDNGKIKVVNKGYLTTKNKYKSATGTAWVPDSKFPGQLKVSFFGPFAGNYYIVELDKDYQYVLIGEPSRKYLWILARTPELDINIYENLINIAKNKGFAVENILKIKHDCEK